MTYTLLYSYYGHNFNYIIKNITHYFIVIVSLSYNPAVYNNMAFVLIGYHIKQIDGHETERIKRNQNRLCAFWQLFKRAMKLPHFVTATFPFMYYYNAT